MAHKLKEVGARGSKVGLEVSMRMNTLTFACMLVVSVIAYSGEGPGSADPTVLAEKAQAGDVAAMVKLGGMYKNGKGVPQDFVKAREWYERAAAANSPSAMNNLGILFDEGKGVAQDFVKAREWYEKAAQMGSSYAASNLALLFQNGKGMEADQKQAYVWTSIADKLGSDKAAARLKAIARKLSPEDLKGSQLVIIQLFEKMAQAGNARAMTSLFDIYSVGEGVPKDDAKAGEWIEKAARAGDMTAIEVVAALYAEGTGVPKDTIRACAWGRVLATLSGAEVTDQRTAIARDLSDEDFGKAKSLADQWIKEIQQRKAATKP
jgi:uncharacterized protein